MDTQNTTRVNGNSNGNGLALRDSNVIEYPYFVREGALAEYIGGAPKENPLTLRDYFKVLFRQKAVILATVVAVMATVIVGLKLMTPVYEAHVKMLILAEKQVESPYYRSLDDGFKTEMALTQSEIVKANPVLERVVKALKLDERPLDYEKEFASPLKQQVIDLKTGMLKKKIQSPEQEKFMRFKVALESLKKNIKVKPVSNTNIFSISVRDYSPIAAATIANTISRYYVIFDLEQQLAELQIKYGDKHMAVVQLKDNIRKMEKSITGTPDSYVDAMGPASVKILEQASMPTEPIGISKALILPAAFFASLFLGIVLAFGFELLDPTFRSPQDVERTLGGTLLGSVPKRKFGSRLVMKDPMITTKYHESLQHLADQMHIVIKAKGLQSILFTSMLHGEGTSTTAVNLANYLSRSLGHKVLLIDANLRRPAVHKAFRIPNRLGLADVLDGKASFDTSVWEISPTLGVLPAGKSRQNPVTLLDSSGMAEVLSKARERYEIVLVDCVHLKGFKDAEILSASVDGMVVVIAAGHTRRQAVKAAIAPLEQKKASVIGAILNKRAFDVPKMIYERV